MLYLIEALVSNKAITLHPRYYVKKMLGYISDIRLITVGGDDLLHYVLKNIKDKSKLIINVSKHVFSTLE